MRKLIRKVIKLPLYISTLEVVLYKKKDKKELKKRYPAFVEDIKECHSVVFYHEDSSKLFVFFPYKDKLEPVTHGIIAHESFHIMNRCFNNVRVTYNTHDSQEHAAYFLEYIVDKIHEVFKENGEIIK